MPLSIIIYENVLFHRLKQLFKGYLTEIKIRVFYPKGYQGYDSCNLESPPNFKTLAVYLENGLIFTHLYKEGI